MDLNYMEAQVIYTAVENLRDNLNVRLDEMHPLDPDKNNCINLTKACNSVLRKIKTELKNHGNSVL